MLLAVYCKKISGFGILGIVYDCLQKKRTGHSQ